MLLFARSHLKRFWQDQAGAVIVETAIILPLMIILSAGVYEFSNAIYTRLSLEAGVTDAARYLARCVHTTADKATCEVAAQNLAVTGQATSGGTARVKGWATSDIKIRYISTLITVDATTGEQNYRGSGGKVLVAQVSTDYIYYDPSNPNLDHAGLDLLGVLNLGALTLSVSHQERVIGW